MSILIGLKMILLIIMGYLLGSIPFGLILTKTFTSVDIRTQGSGNIGATNVRRTAGNLLGALTLIADVIKGALPVAFGLYLLPEALPGREIYLSLVALAAFIGHLYPVYFGFKDGGKGVATAAGCFLVLSPLATLVALLVFVLGVCWYNRVSVGSLLAAAVLPLAVWKATDAPIITACAGVCAMMIVYRHRANIKRLLIGQEPEI
jgi:glycerol-3-phosphate acyltransferase PlsY